MQVIQKSIEEPLAVFIGHQQPALEGRQEAAPPLQLSQCGDRHADRIKVCALTAAAPDWPHTVKRSGHICGAFPQATTIVCCQRRTAHTRSEWQRGGAVLTAQPCSIGCEIAPRASHCAAAPAHLGTLQDPSATLGAATPDPPHHTTASMLRCAPLAAVGCQRH